MARPLNDKIILPLDTGNTGKTVRTRTRVVNALTVHDHFAVNEWAELVLGVYALGMAQQTILAAAQNGTSSGFAWCFVPTGTSGKKARLRKLTISSLHSTTLATPSGTRIVAQRFTYTGTPSGASAGTASKIDTAAPNPVLQFLTAMTGMTITLVGTPFTVIPVAQCLTAVGGVDPNLNDGIDRETEDCWLLLAAGEGFVIYQDTAGVASDTRKLNIRALWDEIDTA